MFQTDTLHIIFLAIFVYLIFSPYVSTNLMSHLSPGCLLVITNVLQLESRHRVLLKPAFFLGRAEKEALLLIVNSWRTFLRVYCTFGTKSIAASEKPLDVLCVGNFSILVVSYPMFFMLFELLFRRRFSQMFFLLVVRSFVKTIFLSELWTDCPQTDAPYQFWSTIFPNFQFSRALSETLKIEKMLFLSEIQ